jgi:hypothetical protein
MTSLSTWVPGLSCWAHPGHLASWGTWTLETNSDPRLSPASMGLGFSEPQFAHL